MSMSTAVGPPKTAMKRTMSATMIGPRSSPGRNIHTLHIAAPVTRFKWRPFTDHDRSRSRLTPASSNLIDLDAHEAMMIVSTAPISGAVGGNGSIELWTFHRPFLALSKVEGHEEGAVTDFVCLSQVFEETHIQHSKNQLMHSKYLWQHTLSVGRDGKCLIQNLARGMYVTSLFNTLRFSNESNGTLVQTWNLSQTFYFCIPLFRRTSPD